jgi:hypothetical protein
MDYVRISIDPCSDLIPFRRTQLVEKSVPALCLGLVIHIALIGLESFYLKPADYAVRP